MKRILLLICFIGLFSCNKENKPVPINEIYGFYRWEGDLDTRAIQLIPGPEEGTVEIKWQDPNLGGFIYRRLGDKTNIWQRTNYKTGYLVITSKMLRDSVVGGVTRIYYKE